MTTVFDGRFERLWHIFDGRFERLWHIHRHHITQKTKMVPHRRWSELSRDRCPHAHLSDPKKVEKQNNLAINVFGWDKASLSIALASSHKTYRGSTCYWLKRPANFTTPGSRTSTAYSTIKASTGSASTFASAVSMAT